MTALFNQIMRFVLMTSARYNIDESHGLGHSLNVLNFSNKIYSQEQYLYPPLKTQEKVIYAAAALHDMCDKKYLDVNEGIQNIDSLLEKVNVNTEERTAILNIIDTISYSKVKENGFPDHGDYQRAYHVVREADLMAAYDFDRCMLYKMHLNKDGDMKTAFEDSRELFNTRVFLHKKDELLTTQYALENHDILANQAVYRISSWEKTLSRITKLPK